MDMYKASGEENLRADHRVKAGAMTESPSGAGKDAGGTSNLKETTMTKVGATKEASPGQRSIDTPPGLQSFNDDQVR
jgi:hypothetical protein